jgi:hypothetical protein
LIATSTLALAATLACGNRDNTPDRDEAIRSVSSHAVEAWAEAGPRGLLDYLSVAVQARCTIARLQDTLASQPTPAAWVETKDIKQVSPTETTATVVFESDGQKLEQTWSFALENFSWRVSDLPGLSECTS